MKTGLVLKLTKYVWFETVTHAQMGQEISYAKTEEKWGIDLRGTTRLRDITQAKKQRTELPWIA